MRTKIIFRFQTSQSFECTAQQIEKQELHNPPGCSIPVPVVESPDIPKQDHDPQENERKVLIPEESKNSELEK